VGGFDGNKEGIFEGTLEGPVGNLVGDFVGPVGFIEGFNVKSREGKKLGEIEGSALGDIVVGNLVGTAV
jgi:hypothetical protein